MQQALGVGLGAVVLGFVFGWLLRRIRPHLGAVLTLTASTLARLLGVVAFCWIAARAASDGGGIGLVLAAFFSLLALFLVLTSAVMVYARLANRGVD